MIPSTRSSPAARAELQSPSLVMRTPDRFRLLSLSSEHLARFATTYGPVNPGTTSHVADYASRQHRSYSSRTASQDTTENLYSLPLLKRRKRALSLRLQFVAIVQPTVRPSMSSCPSIEIQKKKSKKQKPSALRQLPRGV
jgi:hypothetical protein